MRERDLERLRDRIVEIDERILKLARDRIECARAIGRVKTERGRAVRDFSRERVVLEHTRATCDALGLPFELGEGVLHVLIEEAVRVQEALRERITPTDPGEVVVVGGGGGMGGWLCRYLEAQGHGVTVVDPGGGPAGFPTVATIADGWETADVVPLAVPLGLGPAIWDEVLALPPGPLVFDIFSLKSPVVERVRDAVARGHVAGSVHPQHGPLRRRRPDAGRVIYDGLDLADLDIEAVRGQIGVVLQGGHLSPGDLLSNIVGHWNFGLEDAWEAVRKVGLEEDIRAMPMQMHTPVGDAMSTFSTGQQQRVRIARAIIHGPPLLYLDEATSALDNRVQSVVAESLAAMKMTRVVIAHRLSTIQHADRIYYLDRGRVIESGDYDALMKRNGPFAALAKRQLVESGD